MGGPRSSPALSAGRNSSTTAVEAVDQSGAAFSPEPASLRYDVITLGLRAVALLRAGLAVRAFVMNGIEHVRRSVTLASGRILVLENGLYR